MGGGGGLWWLMGLGLLGHVLSCSWAAPCMLTVGSSCACHQRQFAASFPVQGSMTISGDEEEVMVVVDRRTAIQRWVACGAVALALWGLLALADELVTAGVLVSAGCVRRPACLPAAPVVPLPVRLSR